eukprot:1160849-Pelagomonas_calceolata.AAC.3
MEQRGTRTRAPWDNSTPGQETTRSGFSCLVCLQEAPLSNASLSLTVGWDHGQRSVPSPPYCAAHQGQQGSGPCKKCLALDQGWPVSPACPGDGLQGHLTHLCTARQMVGVIEKCKQLIALKNALFARDGCKLGNCPPGPTGIFARDVSLGTVLQDQPAYRGTGHHK